MKAKRMDLRKYSLVLILVIMIIVCSVMSDSFFTVTNLTNILKQVSIVTICA